eukprot:1985595-Rhodomonas_salina.1
MPAIPSYASSGTDKRNDAISPYTPCEIPLSSYAMSGTEIGDSALPGGVFRSNGPAHDEFRPASGSSLRARYAMSGTGIAHAGLCLRAVGTAHATCGRVRRTRGGGRGPQAPGSSLCCSYAMPSTDIANGAMPLTAMPCSDLT